MWQGRESVSQRSDLDVLKRTWPVEPIGLYASSSALIGRSSMSARLIAGCNPLTRHVREFLIHEMCRISVAFADKIVSSHFLVMRLNCPNKWSLRFAVRVATVAQNQIRGHFIDDRAMGACLHMYEGHIHGLADDAGISCLGGSDQVGC